VTSIAKQKIAAARAVAITSPLRGSPALIIAPENHRRDLRISWGVRN
jgi:hypothetical protein